MYRPSLALLGCLSLCAADAESYPPTSHITRGIYAPAADAMDVLVWSPWGAGFERVEDTAHSGRFSVRCVNEPSGNGQGIGQSVELNQTEPRPIRIAGWSRAENVQGAKGWQYSLYVDFRYADGTSWPMQIAAFSPGSHDWEYAETIAQPEKPLASARFYAFIRQIGGTVWFDDLFLGEPDGKNLLRAADFEGDLTDTTARDRLFATLAELHINALHTYLGGGMREWNTPDDPDNLVRRFLNDARARGVGVWLTLGVGTRPIKDADDPNFPQYYCVNGAWGDDWTNALAKAAAFPFAGLSMVPDEYNYNNWHLTESGAKHPDERVAAFYKDLGAYCSCPACRERFRAAYGRDLPEVRTNPKTADDVYRQWLEFRYDSTTAWLARNVAAVKAVNPDLRADSLICVTPICSDWWYGPGIAWDRAGYEAGLEYATTDPYILLHNYLGDSNHWYVTETTEHLAGASPARRCGVALEASRLRPEDRELDPVEIYGSALSAVWHGARELAWWHYNHITDRSKTTERSEVSRRAVGGVYGLLERIDDWFDGDRPYPGVAFLFSRASCDWWRFYAEAADAPEGVLTHPNSEPPEAAPFRRYARYAALAQKEVLSYLFRQGYPTTLFYLESVRPEELADYPIVVVPFPYAIADDRVRLLEELARAGKRVVIVSEVGTLDERGARRDRPALLDLIGLRAAPSGVAEVTVTEWRAAHEAVGQPLGTVTVYDRLELADGVNQTNVFDGRHVWIYRQVGAGQVAFLAGELGYDLPANRDNEKRTRAERIAPSPLNAAAVYLWREVLRGSIEFPLLNREVVGDDVEVALRWDRTGRPLLLCVNWQDEPAVAELPPTRPFVAGTDEAYRMGADGIVRAETLARGEPRLRLAPQEILVARLAAPE